MICTVMGYFKAGIDTAPARLQPDFNEHLAQPFRHIRLAGALRDRDGARIGIMIILETESFEEAEAYLERSPYFAAHLYERVEVAQYAIEAGRLG